MTEQAASQYSMRAIRLLDWMIMLLVLLLLLSWISGGMVFTVGQSEFRLSVEHGYSVLFRPILGLALIRWLIQFQWSDTTVRFAPGWLNLVRRLLDIAILVRVGMVIWALAYGEVRMPLLRTIAFDQSFILIYLMLLIRLLLSRRFGGATLMISTAASLLIAAYGTEFYLEHMREKVLTSHYGQIYTAQAAAADYPIAVPDDYNPSRHAGLKWTWGHQVASNRFGFREKEFQVPKPDGVLRVMVLGDSLTWGAGLSLAERYTERLAYLLRSNQGNGRVEVLNFGMPGGPTTTELKHLREYQDQVDPDLLIVGFCVNDPQPRGQNYSVERSRLHPLYQSIAALRHYGFDKTYSFIISRIDNLLISLGIIPRWHDALNRVYRADSHEWQSFEQALAGIKEISDQRGLPPPIFALLIQGVAADYVAHDYIVEWFQKAGRAAGHKGFTVVDPMPRILAEMTSDDLAVNPLDFHPSAKVNRIYAEALAEPVQQALKTLQHDTR